MAEGEHCEQIQKHSWTTTWLWWISHWGTDLCPPNPRRMKTDKHHVLAFCCAWVSAHNVEVEKCEICAKKDASIVKLVVAHNIANVWVLLVFGWLWPTHTTWSLETKPEKNVSTCHFFVKFVWGMVATACKSIGFAYVLKTLANMQNLKDWHPCSDKTWQLEKCLPKMAHKKCNFLEMLWSIANCLQKWWFCLCFEDFLKWKVSRMEPL